MLSKRQKTRMPVKEIGVDHLQDVGRSTTSVLRLVGTDHPLVRWLQDRRGVGWQEHDFHIWMSKFQRDWVFSRIIEEMGFKSHVLRREVMLHLMNKRIVEEFSGDPSIII